MVGSFLAWGVGAGCRSFTAPARWAHEDLVERHSARPRDSESDDLGDVLRRDRGCLIHRLGGRLGLGVGDVVGEFGGDSAWLDDDHSHIRP
jgi:hypothetical protein